jgi:hypothetical protein
VKFAARAALFAFVLLADASLVLAVPGSAGGRPLLFAALAAGVALHEGSLAGGAWGFAGGLALGLLFDDLRIGSRALGGLLAGSVPVILTRVVYAQRLSGQFAVGAAAGACYDLAQIVTALVRDELAAGAGALAFTTAVDACLTGAACPLLLRVLAALERRV